ncbi:hypothetical protein V8C44DRAFT_178522 [Trichoderma aethiopicum]
MTQLAAYHGIDPATSAIASCFDRCIIVRGRNQAMPFGDGLAIFSAFQDPMTMRNLGSAMRARPCHSCPTRSWRGGGLALGSADMLRRDEPSHPVEPPVRHQRRVGDIAGNCIWYRKLSVLQIFDISRSPRYPSCSIGPLWAVDGHFCVPKQGRTRSFRRNCQPTVIPTSHELLPGWYLSDQALNGSKPRILNFTACLHQRSSCDRRARARHWRLAMNHVESPNVVELSSFWPLARFCLHYPG